jgi:hypothetical protein
LSPSGKLLTSFITRLFFATFVGRVPSPNVVYPAVQQYMKERKKKGGIFGPPSGVSTIERNMKLLA